MNIRNGVKDQGFSQDMKLCEILGYMAELVVAQEYNVDFDYTITPRSGSYDLIIKDKRIDVKICKPVGSDRDMIVVSETKKVDSCDIYFFTKFVESCGKKFIHLYGWVKSEDIIKDENKISGRKGYWYPKTKLNLFK